MNKTNLFAKGVALTLGLLTLVGCNKENPIENPDDLNAFTIVGETEIALEQVPTTDYSAVNFELDVEGIAAALGCEVADMKLAAYSEEFKNFDVESTAGNGGFWLTAEGAVINWGEGAAFFIEPVAAESLANFRVGQFPEALKAGDVVSADVYLINNMKAYKVAVKLTILEPVITKLADFKKVGETTFEMEQEPTTDYSSLPAAVDLTAIATALGCEVADITLAAPDSLGNIAGSTANNGGYWLTAEGVACGWGEGAAVYAEPNENDLSVLNVGQFPEAFKGGEEVNIPVYFLGNGNAYVYNIKLTITVPKTVETFTSVYETTITLTQQPDNNYAWSKGAAIPAEVGMILGTDEWKAYGLNPQSEDGTVTDGAAIYTKDYNCTPYPGFWLNGDGRSVGWGENAIFGVTINGGGEGIQMIQYPERCKAGDSFKAQVFLVNEDNGNMVTINLVYNIVE